MASLNDILIEAGLKEKPVNEARRPKYEVWNRKHAADIVIKHVNMKKIEDGKVTVEILIKLAADIKTVVEDAYAEGYDEGVAEGEKIGRQGEKSAAHANIKKNTRGSNGWGSRARGN